MFGRPARDSGSTPAAVLGRRRMFEVIQIVGDCHLEAIEELRARGLLTGDNKPVVPPRLTAR